MPNNVPLRQDVPLEHRWNVESIFPNDDAWDAEFKRIEEAFPSLARFRGRLADSAATLADWFLASEEIEMRAGKVVLYASMRHTPDTTDQVAVGLNDRARGLAARIGAATSFAEPEMLALGFARLREWMKQEARLAPYAHYFERLEQRAAHVRSAEVEELLSQVSDAFRTGAATHGILADADLKCAQARNDAGETFEVTQGSINALRTHPDRTVRRTAFESYADAHLAVKNTMANALAAGVKQDVFRMRARKYASSLEAALAPNHIPLDVFHNLIKTFRANLPTWHRYWAVRKRILGYDTLYTYDEKAPLTNAKPRVEFAQAIEWISAGMQPLGDEYVATMRRGLLQDRWVDKYPNQGKRAGAFSTGVPGTMPFILMSYNDDLFSMSTLAHELGHSLHKYFTQKTQPFVYRSYGLFLAETASNFNQALVRAHMLKTQPDRALQIGIIEEAMANFHRYFFIMPTLARFELEIHERIERGKALTADSMNALLADLFSEGYGADVVVDRERVGVTWAQFPTHLYSNFYVYQYATGISAAHALSENILSGKADAVTKYLEFLRAGGSQFPLDILKRAGVDLTTPEPIEKTFGVMAQYVNRLEQLLQ